MHNLSYRSLILLQLPLHLFTRILQGQNEGSLLLMFNISGLTLHSSLFTETHFNILQLKNVIAVKKYFLINPNIILYYSFSLGTCEWLTDHQQYHSIIINNNIIAS